MKLHTEHETLKTKMEGVRNTINDYKAAISFVFGGTDVELEQAIENFQQGLCEKQKLIETLEREEENVVREQKRHQLLISEEQKKLGQLMRDLERNREKIAERNSAMIKLCEDLSIATSHAHLSEVDEVARVISSIEQAVRHNNNSVLSLKTKQEQEVAELQKGIYNLRDDRAKLLQVIENKKSALAQNKEDLIKVKGDIQEVDQSAEMLGRLQTKLDRVKKELDDINQNTDIESLENEIKQADKEREMHEDNLTIIQGEIDQLQTLSNIQAELDIQKSNKSRKEAEIQKLTARHKDSLKHLLKEVPEQGIKFRLQACIDRLADEITSKKAEAKSLEHKIATLEIEKTHLSEKLMSAKRSHESDECAITEACKGKDYESYLLELSNKVQELQDHKGTLSSSEYMFRRYVQKLQQNKPCCPLCHRNFSAEDEVVKLISELSLKVRELPTKLRTNKQQLDVTQEEYRNLLQLKPKFDRLSTLSNSEIPGIQSSLEAVDRKLETANEKLALIQAELVSPQTDETLAKSIQGDIILLEQYISECKQISRDIQKIESKLPSGSNRTLKEAMNERNNAQACFQNARQTVEKLQTKKNDLMTKRHRLQEEKNKIQDQQMRISGNTQMRAQLSERQKELESLEVIMQMELDKYMEDSAKVVNQLEQSSRQMRARLASNADELDRLTKKVSTLILRGSGRYGG
ncbi:hypothetical protein AAG570_011094 [Ranatra chinensis]|uniref:Zinc-hook domain-containing protein n=1 Tax=Ranatra chinensis TaxID=642074 RepID=A0ABD0YJS6_9HEMI